MKPSAFVLWIPDARVYTDQLRSELFHTFFHEKGRADGMVDLGWYRGCSHRIDQSHLRGPTDVIVEARRLGNQWNASISPLFRMFHRVGFVETLQ